MPGARTGRVTRQKGLQRRGAQAGGRLLERGPKLAKRAPTTMIT